MPGWPATARFAASASSALCRASRSYVPLVRARTHMRCSLHRSNTPGFRTVPIKIDGDAITAGQWRGNCDRLADALFRLTA
jgi:hypothetical protein